MLHKDVFLTGAVRTPIGRLGGVFASVSAPKLGAEALKGALQRSGVKADQVDEVIFGNVIGAGLGQNVARQVAIGAGLSPAVGATTVNKVCGSGLRAVIMAAQAIQCEDAEVVVAGGTENMSRAPYLLDKARYGYKMGDGVLIDSMLRDGLWDVYNDLHMGLCGDRCASRYDLTREMQDDYAIESYNRALQAMDGGFLKDEIIPVEIKNGKTATIVAEDEEPRRFNQETFRRLRPAFGDEGTVTAGNASSINDGAAAMVVLSRNMTERLGVRPQGRILGYTVAAREPEWFTIAPVDAIRKLLDQLKLRVTDIDLFEINEAFSVVPMMAIKELKIPRCKVNVYGGAVALGHPIGASGARTLATLLNAMKRREARLGLDVLCIGGGEAVAMVVERC